MKEYFYQFAQRIKSYYLKGNRFERKIKRTNYKDIEEIYYLSDGFEIPIYCDYRYRVKPCWKQFKAINILNYLKENGVLNEKEKDFLKYVIGNRTILKSQNEIEEFTLKIVKKTSFLFEEDSFNHNSISNLLFKKDSKTINEEINRYKKMHKNEFKNIKRFCKNNFNIKAKILEIGYETGGVSVFAFEKLGFQAFGIDNNHDGLVNSAINKVDRNKKLVNSKSKFVIGDISRKTEFEESFFDIVYSVSVLEHIKNLRGAFKEMKRILKPGGLIIHNYGPYFSHNGAHALGIPDCPWGHLMMNEKEFLKYIEDVRPFEADQAKGWVANAVHRGRTRTLSEMQKLIFSSGFELLYWNTEHSPINFLSDLTPEIIKKCFQTNSHLSFDDLITTGIYFVARSLK